MTTCNNQGKNPTLPRSHEQELSNAYLKQLLFHGKEASYCCLFQNCHYKATACNAWDPFAQIPLLCRDCCPQLPCPCFSTLWRLVFTGAPSSPRVSITRLWSRFNSSLKISGSAAELLGFGTVGEVAKVFGKCSVWVTSTSSGYSGIVANGGVL